MPVFVSVLLQSACETNLFTRFRLLYVLNLQYPLLLCIHSIFSKRMHETAMWWLKESHVYILTYLYILSTQEYKKVDFFNTAYLSVCMRSSPAPHGFCLSNCIYFCFSHLGRRASVKQFVSLQYLNLRQSVGLLGRGISPSESRYLHSQHKHRINAEKHPCYEGDSNRAGEDNSCLRARGHCEPRRLDYFIHIRYLRVCPSTGGARWIWTHMRALKTGPK
jgi:hypothetical protein